MPDRNDNYKEWKGTVNEWRKHIDKRTERMERDICEIKEYITGKRAVEKFINGLIGFIAGVIGGLIAVLSKWKIGG